MTESRLTIRKKQISLMWVLVRPSVQLKCTGAIHPLEAAPEHVISKPPARSEDAYDEKYPLTNEQRPKFLAISQRSWKICKRSFCW